MNSNAPAGRYEEGLVDWFDDFFDDFFDDLMMNQKCFISVLYWNTCIYDLAQALLFYFPNLIASGAFLSNYLD